MIPWAVAGVVAWAAAVSAVAGEFPGGGWTRSDLTAAGRVLASATPAVGARGQVLTVVIEGDGAAHDRKGRPTDDPTPRRATGLTIAQAWPGGPTVWLGRLCQFTARVDPACTPADWTTGRFSEGAVLAANAAIDQLMERTGARQVRLVGWSGGGVLAVLAAARREDLAGVVTIAAPLDLAGWSRWRGTSPLTGSLDPGDLAASPRTPQVHLFGRFDPIVPPQAVMATAQRLAGADGHVEIWPERHACCWAHRARSIAALADGDGSGAPAP